MWIAQSQAYCGLAPACRRPQRCSVQLSPQKARLTFRRSVCADAVKHFEPVIDQAVVASQLIVLSAVIGAAAYWWNVVVPSERAALAKSKRKGEVRDYLIELKNDKSRSAERWFYSEWLDNPWLKRRPSPGEPIEPPNTTSLREEITKPAAEPLLRPREPEAVDPIHQGPAPRVISLDQPLVTAVVLLLAACFLVSVFKA